MAFVLVPTMSVALFGIFECRSFDTAAQTFLYNDLSLGCYTPTHEFFMFYSFVLMLSPIGGPLGNPLMTYFLLRRPTVYEAIAEPPGLTTEAQLLSRRENVELGPLLFLFDNYVPHCWYFECFETLR